MAESVTVNRVMTLLKTISTENRSAIGNELIDRRFCISFTEVDFHGIGLGFR